MNQYSFLLKSLIPFLVIASSPNAVSAQPNKTSSSLAQQEREQQMERENAQKLIEKFYHFFNQKELEKLYTLIDDNIQFAMNEDDIEKGKAAFIKMMQQVTTHYQEHVDNVIYMASENGQNVATKFIFKGKYVNTDTSHIPANGQPYSGSALNYFEIQNNKIVKAIGFYNHRDWIKQVSQ